MNERIRRPHKFEDFLQSLGGPGANSEKPFDSLKSVLLFAASIAFFKELAPVEFDKSGERIPFAYFSGEYEKSFISALALAKSGDISIIHPSRMQEQIYIFENMANAGLEWLYSNISPNGTQDSFLLSLVTEANKEKNIIDEIFA